MDQQKATTKSTNKILKFLPRAASSVSFQNPAIFSPAKDKRSSEKTYKSNLGIGFSGPMLSMIPADTRRKIKNDSSYTIVYEPTSPRVSCMGQVKCKKLQKEIQRRSKAGAGSGANKPPVVVKVPRSTSVTPARTYNVEDDHEEALKSTEIKRKKKLGFKKIFGGVTGGRKPDAGNNKSTPSSYADKAPSLNTMKRFSSGRDTLSGFDWRKEVADMDSGRRTYYSDDETDDDQEVIIPSSAPVVMRNKGIGDDFNRVRRVDLEPRKEINLWKRRTMPQPKPLRIT